MATAIVVDDVWKKFRLYDERNQSLKAAVMRGRRARYREFDALKGVSFEIPEGSTFGLIGENGSGKSTLLKCIARILRPERGAIATHGQDLGAARARRRLPSRAVGPRERVPQRRDPRHVEEAARRSASTRSSTSPGSTEFIDSPVKNYSSGMYVRLGFSVAINVDPDILLVDEVLAVGDEQFQRKCSEKFAELKESGKTIVVVSHALGTMRTLCDQLALLEHGNLVAVGPVGRGRRRRTSATSTTTGSPTASTGRAGVPARRRIERDRAARRRRPSGHLGAHRRRGHVPLPLPDDRADRQAGVRHRDPHASRACTSRRRTPATRATPPTASTGDGHVDLHVDRLLLVPGIYDVSASISDYACMHMYDCRHRSFRFDVERGHPEESGGVMSLGGVWGGLDVRGLA